MEDDGRNERYIGGEMEKRGRERDREREGERKSAREQECEREGVGERGKGREGREGLRWTNGEGGRE